MVTPVTKRGSGSTSPKSTRAYGRSLLKQTPSPAAKQTTPKKAYHIFASPEGSVVAFDFTGQVIKPSAKSFSIPKQGYRFVYDMQPVDRASLVKSGVPSTVVTSISDDMGVTKDKFVRITGLSLATLNRKIANQKALSADESERLVGLVKLIGQVDAIVKESGDPKGFKPAKWFSEWIEQPAKPLGGRKPQDLLDTNDGREAVSKLLSQMQSGAYA